MSGLTPTAATRLQEHAIQSYQASSESWWYAYEPLLRHWFFWKTDAYWIRLVSYSKSGRCLIFVGSVGTILNMQ